MAAALEIDGYIRKIQITLNPFIIPSSINVLVHLYYNPWYKLQALPDPLTYIYPDPLYYHCDDDNKDYIIISPMYEDTTNIWKYDCFDNKWNVLTKYPLGFDPICHGIEMDPINEELYIFHGQTAIFGKYNLNTNKWTIFCDHDHLNRDKYNMNASTNPYSVWIPHPFNEIHAMIEALDMDFKQYHSKYNQNKSKFMIVSKTEIRFSTGLLMAKIRDTEQQILMVIGCSDEQFEIDDKIWFCDIKYFEWKIFPNKLPIKAYTKAVIAYNQVIIIQIYNNDIPGYTLYCLEIQNCDSNNQCKWIKCDIEPPKTYKMLIVKDYLYFMIFRVGSSKSFEKIHLSRVLPLNLYMKYAQNTIHNDLERV